VASTRSGTEASSAQAADADPNTHLKGIAGDTAKMVEKLGSAVTSLGEISGRMKTNAEDWNPLS